MNINAFKLIPKLELSFILLMILLFTAFQTFACDVCGCGMPTTSLGILPQFRKHYIGIQYSNRSFTTIHYNSMPIDILSTTKESFQTMEFRARFFINPKIQFFTMIPFNVNKQIETNQTQTIQGLGDISGLLNYNLINTGDSIAKKWKHNLQIGGGIKAATGKFNTLSNNITNANIQVGSGSWDFLIDLIHTVRIDKFGINTNVIYKLNQPNSNLFKFGNRTNINSSVFYWANYQHYSILPNLGVAIEHAQPDAHNSFAIPKSGGLSMSVSAGIDVYLKNFTIGCFAQLPFYQGNVLVTNKSNFNCRVLRNF